MVKPITSFSGEYRFLSNFYPSMIKYVFVMYPTVEHAYQSAKTKNLEERLKIKDAKTPGLAKRLGKSLELRSDWEDVKFAIMKNLVEKKFYHKDLAEMLKATGEAELVEGNHWGDTIWGQCPLGNGQNLLGKILMEVREGL